MEALAKQVEETCKTKPLAESMEWIGNLTQGLSNNIDAQIPLEYQRERIIFEAFNQRMSCKPDLSFVLCIQSYISLMLSSAYLSPHRTSLLFSAKGDQPATDSAPSITFPSLNDFATSATFYRTKSLQLFAVSLIHRCLRETMAIEQNRAAAQARKGL